MENIDIVDEILKITKIEIINNITSEQKEYIIITTKTNHIIDDSMNDLIDDEI